MARQRLFALVATFALVAALAVGLVACQAGRTATGDAAGVPASDELYLPEIRGEEDAVVTTAPELPPAITRDYATRVVANMDTVEGVKELADGAEYTFWTFGGSVPGPRVRVLAGGLVD